MPGFITWTLTKINILTILGDTAFVVDGTGEVTGNYNFFLNLETRDIKTSGGAPMSKGSELIDRLRSVDRQSLQQRSWPFED